MHVRVVSILFLLTIIAPLHAVGESQGKVVQSVSDSALRKYQYCGSDKDCVVAINGCCDCSTGGQMVAINKAQAQEFKAQFDCITATCADSASSTCDEGVVSCIEHRCKYFLNSEISR